MKELTDELNRLYKITKTSAEVSRKTIADLKNNNYNFNDKVVFRQLQEKHTQEALKNNQNFQEKAKKLAKLYKDLLKDEPNAKNEKSYISRCSLYAKALDKSGNKEEAKKWYQKIIDLDKGRDCLEARGAKKYLENNK